MSKTPQQMLTAIELSDRLYYKFSHLVYEQAGIALGDAKRELVRSRLLKRLRHLGLFTFESYYKLLEEQGPDGEELTHMLDAISTNKTDFFRENQHFEFLMSTVMPPMVDKAKRNGSKKIRIWSAACSTGEEPYTLAMLMHDMIAGEPGWDIKILATDISTAVLQKAREGRYEEERVAPVASKMRLNSFTKESTPKGNIFVIKPHLKKYVVFRRLNLMNKSFPFKGKFDVVFCRNVMIYFDRPTQEELVNRIFRYIREGGYFFIGHSESLNSIQTDFRFVKPTIYLRP